MVVNIQNEEGGRGGATSPEWGSLDNPVGGGGGGGGGQQAGQQDNQQKLPAAAASQNQNKPFIAMKVTGTVKWFNVKSGYGFINRKDTGEDVFVHQSAITKNNPKKAVRSVGDGETVVFDVVSGEKGNEAANVTGPDGEPVKGSPYAADKRRGIRPSWWFPSLRSRGPRKQQGKDGGEGEETARDDSKPRRFRNRRYLGGGGGGGSDGGGRGGAYYVRRQQNSGDKNGEKEGGEGEDGGHEEDGRGGGEGRGGRGERGGPRGGLGGGRGPPRRFRYGGNYRGGRQGGPPKPRGPPQQQDGAVSDGGGGGGGSIKDGNGNDTAGSGGAERSRTRGRGGGGNRGRPRYRRPQRSLSQTDKPAKETSQEVQNTTDESAA